MAQDPVEQLMARLRQEYLDAIPGRLEELSNAITAWRAGEKPPTPLPVLFHRLSGSAGAYGFNEVGRLCREIEQWLATEPPRDVEALERLNRVMERIREGFKARPT